MVESHPQIESGFLFFKCNASLNGVLSDARLNAY